MTVDGRDGEGQCDKGRKYCTCAKGRDTSGGTEERQQSDKRKKSSMRRNE